MAQRITTALALAAALVVAAGSAEARRICAMNSGADPVGVRAGHAMYWIDGGRAKCFNTDSSDATIQNDLVSECLERDVIVDLREHACMIADGEEGICVPAVETMPLADDCVPG